MIAYKCAAVSNFCYPFRDTTGNASSKAAQIITPIVDMILSSEI